MSLPYNTQIIMSDNTYIDLGDIMSRVTTSSNSKCEISIQSWSLAKRQLQRETAFLSICLKNDLVKLVFDDGTTQKCSPNHKWFCIDANQYVCAANAIGHDVLCLSSRKMFDTFFSSVLGKRVVDVSVCAGVHTLYDVEMTKSDSCNHNCLVWNMESKGYLLSACCAGTERMSQAN